MRNAIKSSPRGAISKSTLAVLAAILVMAGVAGVLVLRRGTNSQEGRPVPAPSGETVPSPQANGATAADSGELRITIPPEQIANAQIKTEVAERSEMSSTDTTELRTTGTVTSNAYKETPIFPIAGGIVRQVNATLGQKVRQGQSVATIFSTDLANAQGDYLKMLAEHDQHEREHHRVEQLAEIGAASREELEQSKAKIDSMEASLASSRQQLILLGMTRQQIESLRSSSQVNSIVLVVAPVSGTVISRDVNQNEVVATGKELFRIADLSIVWVIGQVYEKDLPTVKIGTVAAITTPASGRTLTGRVSYIDPKIDLQTRTAQVRIEVSNPGEILKIGMFVDVGFGVAPQSGVHQEAVTVSKAAIQLIGSRQVVFVATDKSGVFVQREVKVGPESDGRVIILGGVSAGDRVVTEGSFLLQAESLKQRPEH